MSDAASPSPWQLTPQENELYLTFQPPTTADPMPLADLERSLKSYLNKRGGRWGDQTQVRLGAYHYLLDGRQLQAIADCLQTHNLTLQWVETTRRQTAVAAASAGLSVDQQPPPPPPLLDAPSAPPLAKPLVVRQTLRSGADIRHAGDVVIIGDVNPGSCVVADGDILLWGCLRGTAHAGASGNQQAVIMILRLAACQIRIADVVARVGPEGGDRPEPEIAYITAEGIRLTPARQFQRTSHLP